jgi:hypothetical protein
LIAKPDELWTTLAGETIDGVPIVYSGYVGDNQRTATDNASPPNAEIQLVTPRYTVGQAIYAMAVNGNTGVGAVDAQSTKWVEVKPAREWGGEN